MSLMKESINPYKGLEFLSFPVHDKNLRTVYEVYKASPETLNLQSESNRTIFGEKIELIEIPLPRLSYLSIKVLANNFSGDIKKIEKNLTKNNKTDFFNLLSVELPIDVIINIKNDIYWQRVYSEKLTKNQLAPAESFKQSKNEQPLILKNLALEQKYREYLEGHDIDGWSDFDNKILSQMLAPYLYKFKLNKLMPMKEYLFDYDQNLNDFKLFNYNFEDCHHINLSVLGELFNLTELCLEFTSTKLGRNFHTRFFQFSFLDIKRLGSAISTMPNLKVLKLIKSKMNLEKLECIVASLKEKPIETVDFSFCHLDNDCAYCLTKLMKQNTSLMSLELKGNHFSSLGITTLAYGIQNFSGTLCYFGISRNMTEDDGLTQLGRLMLNSEQITELDCSGILITETACIVIIEIIKHHQNLQYLNISCLPFGKNLGDNLIISVKSNKSILKLIYRDCELSLEQEYQLKLLVDRNNYIKRNYYVETLELRDSLLDVPDKFLEEIKNPILLKSLKSIERLKQCNKEPRTYIDFDLRKSLMLERMKRISYFNKDKIHEQLHKRAQSVAFVFEDDIEKVKEKEPSQFNHFTDEKKLVKSVEMGKPSFESFFKKGTSRRSTR